MFRFCTGITGERHKKGFFTALTSEYDIEDGESTYFPALSEPYREPATASILLEVVGAIGLSFLQKKDETMDTFCVVQVGQDSEDFMEVHRTKTISNDTDPIWTLDSKGICTFTIAEGQTLRVRLCRNKSMIAVGEMINIPEMSLRSVDNGVGCVDLDFNTLIEGVGERHEVEIRPNVFLSLRYRLALPEESLSLSKGFRTSRLDPVRETKKLHRKLIRITSTDENQFHANDFEFQTSDSKHIFSQIKKTVRNPVTNEKETLYQVWPFPDPTRPEETKFLTKQQLHDESRRPSTQWVRGGAGGYGTLDVEILGCEDLPNMDTELVNGVTDAFCACLFEDTVFRTSVVHDSLQPRFMPWSFRAFRFNIDHPSSILFLGVFDYDEGPLESHDPIGRIAIKLDEFENDTMYTLTYPLFDGDAPGTEQQGSITIRVRVSWTDIAEVSKARSFFTPPRSIINTRSKKSLQVIRYLTRGSVDMTEVTVKSVKLYFYELMDYARKYCYLLDVLAEILLWRGRLTIGKDRTIWFPHHSVMLFIAVILCLERPSLIPSIFLYGIAYCLLTVNYHAATHPNPWKQIRSYRQINDMSMFGHSDSKITIAPGQGQAEADLRDKLDLYKTTRVTTFLTEIMSYALSVYRIYSRTVAEDVSTATRGSGPLFSQLYVNYLYYVHILFRSNARIIRILRNFVNWKSTSTYKFTTNCLLLATAWLLFPFKSATFWLARLFVWTVFGPLMMLFDNFVIRKYYRTKEEIIRDGMPDTVEEMQAQIEARPSILGKVVEKPWAQAMMYSGRVNSEELEKLKAFRKELFGQYSENVPLADTSRVQNTPLFSSFAQPYAVEGSEDAKDGAFVDLPDHQKHWSYMPGQRLSGNILLKQTGDQNPVPKL